MSNRDSHGGALAAGALRVLDFIRRFQAVRGYPPSFREIMRGTGQRSTAWVEKQMRLLETEGYLNRRRTCRQPYRIRDAEPRRPLGGAR